jgi:sodium/proline symporter
MSWMTLSVIGSLATGLFGLAYVAGTGTDLADPEKIFITLSQLLFNPWIAGFLLAAILAAIMSTVDSQLLVSSSVLTRDLYNVLFRKNAGNKELVWMSRATVILIAVIAWYLSTDQNSSVLKLVSYAWAGFGASFGPLVILSLYHKNITRNGAIAGIISGALTVIIWKQLSGGIFDLYELLPAFVIASICILIFSKTEKPSQENLDAFAQTWSKLRK